MENRRLHFMGIGGAGLSAVAELAKEAGYEISGCDLDKNSQFLKGLLKEKLNFEEGHDPSHLENIDELILSPAIESLDPKNPELLFAKEKNIPVSIGEEFLAKKLIGEKKLIAVSGTHGKSTTTAMVAKILEEAGLDPTVLVGAIVSDWGRNYRIGKGDYFVLEADEYQDKILLYSPYLSVITAIEMDHPEYFSSLDQLKESFEQFANSSSDYVVLGENIQLKLNDEKVKVLKLGQDFQIEKFDLKLIGEFNQTNASLAFEVAKCLGIDEEVAKKALEKFTGVGRRFEFHGEEKEVKVFDDYGHHPTAIKATAEAAREKFPDSKIWLIYQPHMFSRTKYLFDSFVEVFKEIPVDEIVLVDIFAARQENTENISSQHIVNEVKKSNTHYIGSLENTAYYLAKNVAVGDIVIVMGAGDIYKLSGMLLEKLKNKG
ncbi:MAG TPA: cyanophycin synthetase [Candidatus Saccharimonadales bacterium]|nr:cyanophycin synthetase [Candidatus Saccharimonadales bacterium]